MSFIENLTAESVNMDAEEFENYTSGKKVPLESWRSNLLMCDGLQKMSQNLKILADLKTQHEEILSGAKRLELEINKLKIFKGIFKIFRLGLRVGHTNVRPI